MAVSLITGCLLAWTQLTCFDGDLTKTEPKRFRNCVLHVAAQLAHHAGQLVVHVDGSWPWASELATAFTRLRAAFP